VAAGEARAGADTAAYPPAGEAGQTKARGRSGEGRHRGHLFPGRPFKLQPRFSAEEHADVEAAAGRAGLTPTGYAAAVVVAAARNTAPPVGGVSRDALGELMDARRALTAFATNVNQAARVLNSGGEAPEWLARAVGLSAGVVRRIDAATVELMARLP